MKTLLIIPAYNEEENILRVHLRRVAVPIRLSANAVGEAIITAARTRPMLIGGERARYSED